MEQEISPLSEPTSAKELRGIYIDPRIRTRVARLGGVAVKDPDGSPYSDQGAAEQFLHSGPIDYTEKPGHEGWLPQVSEND